MRSVTLTLGLIVALALTLGAGALAAPPHAPAAICTWDGTTGNWSDTTKWTGCGGIAPGVGDTATINAGTVTVDQEVTVQDLTFSGGTLQGSNGITVTQVMTWTEGTQSGSGATNIASGATLNVNNTWVTLDARTLNNAGTVNWTATNQWAFNNGAVLNNLAGATFNAQANGVTLGYYGNGVFNNQGAFIRSGPGVSYVGVPFYNTGAVQVTSGTLRPDNGGNSSGAFTANAGAVFQFNSNYTLNPGATCTGAGLYRLTGGTLTISGTLTVPNFEQTGATLAGSGTLTVTGVMTWTEGTQSGSGATTIAAGATLNVNNTWVTLDARTLNNAGTVNWTAGNQWAFNNGAVLNNLAGATFNAQANGVTLGYYGNGVFNNQGTFVRSGPGVSYVGAPFNNSSSVQAQSGTLHLDGGGNSHGVFVVSSGATLNFGGGTHALTLGPADSVSGAGTVAFSGGMTTITGTGAYNVTGSTDVTGGTVNFNLPAITTKANQSNGTLGGSGTLTVTQVMTWTEGTQSGSGATNIASGATLNVNNTWVTLDARTLNNAGTVNWTATNQWAFNNGAVLNNLAGATFNAQANGVTLGYYGNGVFNNQGAFIRSGSGSSSVGVPFYNTGTMQVMSGTLHLNSGNSNGVATVNTGAVLQFNSNYTLNPGATLTGAGLYRLTGGTLTISGTLTVPNFEQTGATLAGSGTLTVTQVMTWTEGTQSGSGATTIAAGATLNVNNTWVTLDARTLNNAGTVNWTAGNQWAFNNGAVLNNLAGATFNAQANGVTLGYYGNGVFNNQGTFVRSGPGVSYVGVPFYNIGTVNVESGVLQFGHNFAQNAGATWLSGGSLTKSGALVFNGGTLGGKGTITGTVSNIGGTVLPGSSPGILRIVGDYTQGPTGTLNIELGGVVSGTQYDLLDVTGAASLSGTLNVSLINGFTPISGTVFRIVNFSTRSGDFITETGMNLGGWLFLLPYYSSDHLSLIVGTTVADLGISVTDGKSYAVAGDLITYTVVVTNAGPDAANGTIVTDTLPETISSVTWTCVASGGSCGALSGSGNLSTTVNLNAGGVITFTIGGRLSPGANGTLINTAYVSHPTDPDPSNNSATDSDIVLYIKVYVPLAIR